VKVPKRASWVIGLYVVSASLASAEDLDAVLSFEAGQEESLPIGWTGGPKSTLSLDETVFHRGNAAGRITRVGGESSKFSSLTTRLSADIAGTKLTFTAWVRSNDVVGHFGLWMRQDRRTGPVDFVNNYALGLKGDQGWQEISISTDLVDNAREISLGLVLNGTGTVWIDDVRIEVDGKAYADAPRMLRKSLPLESDTEFDAGSGIGDLDLTDSQVENVASLIEVWGFVKYHHPLVAVGEVNIDYELFRALPRILAVDSDRERNEVLLAWVGSLGKVDPCKDCATVPDGLNLEPPIAWIHDTKRWGDAFSRVLQWIYRNRPASGEHVFIGLSPGAGNPVFRGEAPYHRLSTVDAGFRLLALARLWNIIEYWFPHRDLVDTPWQDVLRAAIPRLAMPLDRGGYAREMLRVVSEIRDTHANIWSSLDERPGAGDCVFDVEFRFVEGQAIVWALPFPNDTDFEIGDVLIELDGRAVEQLVEEWRPFYAASNHPTRLRDIGRNFSTGPCGEGFLQVRRAVGAKEQNIEIAVKRTEASSPIVSGDFGRDRAGDTYQDLSESVGYLKLSSIESDDVASIFSNIQGKKGLIIDIRNYPNAFVVYELGQRLITTPHPFARVTSADLNNPGAFSWSPPLVLEPSTPNYNGKIAVLVDEISQSQAEFTAMALRVRSTAMVVGSTTAGADGDISPFTLPGGLRTLISGIGIYYPDKTPTQRVGIVPDIEVKPTIEGIRAGRDEVLEAALRYILGDELAEDEIERLAAWP